jgi:hypothetical protein
MFQTNRKLPVRRNSREKSARQSKGKQIQAPSKNEKDW